MLTIYAFLIPVVFYIAIFIVIYKVCSGSSNKRSKYSSAYKGEQGERKVASNLATLNNNYNVINDVMLDIGGKTSQIDHIVVSPFGVFVIETKNYNGMLIGSEYDNQMTHLYNNAEYVIYNPFKQNKSHVRALMHTLNITDKTLFVPILAIADNCAWDIEAKSAVVPFSEVCREIYRHNRRLLSNGEVDEITQAILNANITSKAERYNHIERIKAMNECRL